MLKFRKLIGCLIFSIAIQSISLSALAEPFETIEYGEGGISVVEPQYTALVSITNDLTRKANGDLRCYGYTNVRLGYTAWVKVELQKYDGGWHGVTSWIDNSSTRNATVDESYTPSSGKYRLKVTHKALQGDSEIESTTSYSSVVTVS